MQVVVHGVSVPAPLIVILQERCGQVLVDGRHLGVVLLVHNHLQLGVEVGLQGLRTQASSLSLD